MPCCFATGATPGSGLPLASSSAAVSPMTKTSRQPRHRKVRRDFHPARAIGLGTEPLARRRGDHAGCPHHGARLDACRFRSLADRHAGVVESRDRRAGAHFDAKLFERGSGGFRERRIERREQARRRLHQDDARGARVDRAEVLGKRAISQLGDRAGHLDPGRAPADDHEIQEPRPLGRVGFGFGLFEGEQDAPADVGRVVDGLQPRSAGGPFAVTEIGVLRAGCENQDVVGNAPAVGENLAPLRVDGRHVAENDVDVGLARENAADRRGDVGGRKPRGRDLIEQRLEQMIVVLVDDGDVEWLSGQCFRSGEAAEAGSDDDDAGVGHGDLRVGPSLHLIWGGEVSSAIGRIAATPRYAKRNRERGRSA